MAIYSPGIELASQPTLCDHEVADAASDLFGADAYYEPLGGGANPDVYSVAGPLGRGVLKFYPEGSQQAEFEQYAMRRASAAGVPAPEALDTGVLDTEHGRRPWLAMEHAEGRQMSELALSTDEETFILGGVGRLLADLHGQTQPAPEGYWRQTGVDESGEPTWMFGSWYDYLGNMAETLDNDTDHLLAAGLSAAEIDAILRNLAEYREMVPLRRAFTHADLRKPHVYVDDDLNITSVIDWGSGQANSPEREFSKPFAPDDEPMVAAYADASGYPREELDDRIRRMRIAHIPSLVIFNTRKGRIEEAQSRVQDVRQLLAA